MILTVIEYLMAMEKKIMKKLISLILVVSLALFSLCANGAKETSNNEITVISREDGSGTRGAFIELVGVEQKIDGVKTDLTTENAEIANSTSVVITTVEGNKNAIGYISLGSLSDKVKALKIDGVLPSVETVKSGEYKIARPFNIAYMSLDDLSSDFISFVMSKEGQSIVEKKGYIKISDTEDSYKSSSKGGTLTISGSSSVYPVMEVLVEKYSSLNPNVKVTLLQSDSTTGLNDAINGNSNIGMASRDLKESELGKGLTGLSIALDGIAIIVNNSNSLDGLTTEQVRDIYLGKLTSWDNL
mgnify:FL=1